MLSSEEKRELLADFLMALDEWGTSSYSNEADEILKFIDSGFDLSEYEEKEKCA